MKKLFCLICFALLLSACTNDSTETTTTPAATPASTPTEQVAQEASDPSDEMASLIYEQNCRSCHGTGVMGAPKLGHERYSADIEILVENSINGIGQMPARGGNSSLSDEQVRAAVEYMVDQSK